MNTLRLGYFWQEDAIMTEEGKNEIKHPANVQAIQPPFAAALTSLNLPAPTYVNGCQVDVSATDVTVRFSVSTLPGLPDRPAVTIVTSHKNFENITTVLYQLVITLQKMYGGEIPVIENFDRATLNRVFEEVKRDVNKIS